MYPVVKAFCQHCRSVAKKRRDQSRLYGKTIQRVFYAAISGFGSGAAQPAGFSAWLIR